MTPTLTILNQPNTRSWRRIHTERPPAYRAIRIRDNRIVACRATGLFDVWRIWAAMSYSLKHYPPLYFEELTEPDGGHPAVASLYDIMRWLKDPTIGATLVEEPAAGGFRWKQGARMLPTYRGLVCGGWLLPQPRPKPPKTLPPGLLWTPQEPLPRHFRLLLIPEPTRGRVMGKDGLKVESSWVRRWSDPHWQYDQLLPATKAELLIPGKVKIGYYSKEEWSSTLEAFEGQKWPQSYELDQFR